MSDVTTVSDLETNKKHITFCNEVITGKSGGLASGADIATATNDVTGQVQKTLPKVIEDLGPQYFADWPVAGDPPVTLTNAGQALRYQIADGGDGHDYCWSGAFPKVVSAGSTPTPLGSGGWIDRSDVTLRGDLSASTGVSLVGGAQWKTSVTVSEAGSFAAAVATGMHVDVDVNVTISSNISTITDGQLIRGAGGVITMPAGGQLTLATAGAQAHYLDVVAQSNTYCIVSTADDTLAYNCEFTGSTGHYVVNYSHSNQGVVFCKSKGKGQITPFVFSGCTDFTAAMNTLDDHSGFGIQARWCDGGSISNNTVRNTLYRYNAPAVNGQTTYTFTVPSGGHTRYGFYIQDANGCTARLVTSITVSGTTATVVTSETTVTAAGGDVAVLVGCDALESYQINSGCNNVRISDNYSNGTGDSNVVVGADYHYDGANWVLAPGSVVASDEPKNSVVSGNTLKNALYSNIAVNNSQESISIIDNHCFYAGFRRDVNQVLDCNINCSRISLIMNNDCHSDAAVIKARAGIASTPSGHRDYFVGGETVQIGGNSFHGSFVLGDYQLAQTSSATTRRLGVKIQGQYKQAPEQLNVAVNAAWTTKPTNTTYWSFANSGSGWARNTTDMQSGVACIQTIGGSYVDCTPNFIKLWKSGGIVKLSFRAKGTGYVRPYTNFSGGTVTASSIAISATDWTDYEQFMPVKAFTSYFLRIGSDGSDVAYVDDVMIEFLPVSC